MVQREKCHHGLPGLNPFKISLVSIAVKIFRAINPGKQVEFHQIDRKTHKQGPHQNSDEAGAVEKTDIVKGFEYAKYKYIELYPEKLKALRLPIATTMPIKQFIKAEEFPLGLFDRPYFGVPKDDVQAKALSIMRKALAQTNTLGIGESTSAAASIWWQSELLLIKNKRAEYSTCFAMETNCVIRNPSFLM